MKSMGDTLNSLSSILIVYVFEWHWKVVFQIYFLSSIEFFDD